MSAHNVIVVSANPLGHFIEGNMVVGEGTFKPGQCVSIDASASLLDGRPQYKLWEAGVDGHRSVIIVVRENDLMGMNVDGTYAAGDRFLAYAAQAGDEIQVLFKNVTGTADDVLLGGLLILDDTTGKVIATTGTVEDEPFEAMEALTDPTADTLILVRVLR